MNHPWCAPTPVCPADFEDGWGWNSGYMADRLQRDAVAHILRIDDRMIRDRLPPYKYGKTVIFPFPNQIKALLQVRVGDSILWYGVYALDHARSSFDGLSCLRWEFLGQDPTSGQVFVFFNRRRDQVKALWWDTTGYAIWYKHLEAGCFHPGALPGRDQPGRAVPDPAIRPEMWSSVYDHLPVKSRHYAARAEPSDHSGGIQVCQWGFELGNSMQDHAPGWSVPWFCKTKGIKPRDLWALCSVGGMVIPSICRMVDGVRTRESVHTTRKESFGHHFPGHQTSIDDSLGERPSGSIATAPGRNGDHCLRR